MADRYADQRTSVQRRFDEWRPTILRNVQQLRGSTTGQPHLRNLDRWQRLVEAVTCLACVAS
jgi:hypothetical protein